MSGFLENKNFSKNLQKTYAEQNLDFVDCILYAYKLHKGVQY